MNKQGPYLDMTLTKKDILMFVGAMIFMIIFLYGAWLLQEEKKFGHGAVVTISHTNENGQLTYVVCKRSGWPIHPSHEMTFAQYYDKDGKIVSEEFRVEDRTDEFRTIRMAYSLYGKIVDYYDETDGIPKRREAWSAYDDRMGRELLDEQRAKFGLPNPQN